MKRIGIVGSRRRDTDRDQLLVRLALGKVYEGGDGLVSGGCPQGADRFAEIIAREDQIPITIYYAEWVRLGKRAGYARNRYIAEDATVLIACVAPDRRGGTEDTIRQYLTLGKDQLILV